MLVLTVALALCQLPTPEAADAYLTCNEDRGADTCSTYLPDAPEVEASGPGDASSESIARDNHISKIIYVNRCEGGCVFQPGVTDARENISSIVERTSAISEFRHSEEIFNQTIECIKDVFEPYDVTIVTEDPGPVFHHEAVLAGSGSEIGRGDAGGLGQGGGRCIADNNGISFTFANTFGPNPDQLCAVVAQETAHSFGLSSHTYNCHDPMTYLRSCGRQYFRNILYPCGEFEQDPRCTCGGATRNNHQMLTNVLGRSDVELAKPELELILPADGGSVRDNFFVRADSQDKRGIVRTELWLSGKRVDTAVGNMESRVDPSTRVESEFDAPDWPDGYIDVEVRAYNDLEDFTAARVTVLKGAPCTSGDSCFEGQECIEGGCRFPAASLSLGASCVVDENCLDGACLGPEDEKICANSCNPSVQDACIEGFECSDQGACLPTQSGGCSQSAKGAESAAWLMILGCLGGGLMRRRKQLKEARLG